MKKLLKWIFKQAGYIFMKDNFHKYYVNINSIKSLDIYYLLNERFSISDKLIIFDIGANIGQTSLKFNSYYPDSEIYCFEPIKSTFELLQKNVKQMVNIRPYNFAFGENPDEVEIFHRENSEWNSLVFELNETAKKNGSTSEVIKIETIDNFLKNKSIHKIHILKSDTEGFDMSVLRGAVNSLKNQVFEYLYLEVGLRNGDKQHTYLVEMINYLENFNYRFSGLFEKVYMDGLVLCYANALFSKIKR